MQRDEGDEQTRNDEDVQREEARECRAGDDRPPQHQPKQRLADQRHATDDGGANPQSPIGVLVEPQDLPGERHAERHQQQKHAENPRELPRKLVGAEQNHLAHVDEDHGHHEIRSPSVHGAQEPAERDAMIEVLQAVPGLGGGRNVDDREHDAGEDLEHEDRERRAAEDVPPACRPGGHLVFRHITDRASDLEPLVEPVPDFLDHASFNWAVT